MSCKKVCIIGAGSAVFSLSLIKNIRQWMADPCMLRTISGTISACTNKVMRN